MEPPASSKPTPSKSPYTFTPADYKGIIGGIIGTLILTGVGRVVSGFGEINNFLNANVLHSLKLIVIQGYSNYYSPVLLMLYAVLIAVLMSLYVLTPVVDSKKRIFNVFFGIIYFTIWITYTLFSNVASNSHNAFIRMQESALCWNLNEDEYNTLKKSILSSKTLSDAKKHIEARPCSTRVSLK